MTPTLLREIGEALFGNEWRLPLAEALGINRRTVQRWMAGQNPVPSSVVPDLQRLIAARIAGLARLSDIVH